MLVTLLMGFCGGVAVYFAVVTHGFGITLASTNLLFQWSSPLSIVIIGGFVLGAVLGVLVFALYLVVKAKKVFLWRQVVAGIVFSGLVGGWWAFIAHDSFLQSKVGAPQKVTWRGQVVGLPEVVGGRVTFLFERMKPVASDQLVGGDWAGLVKYSLPLRVIWEGPAQTIKPGQIWRFPLNIKPSLSHHISGIGYVQSGWGVPQLLDSALTYHQLRFALKQRLLDSYSVYEEPNLEPNQKVVPLLLALLLGDRSLLSDGDWQLVSDTGTAHLIAISGLHIGLVASLAYCLVLYGMRYGLRLVRVRLIGVSVYQLAHLAALVAAWVYGAMAGYSIPTQRACVMVTAVVCLRAFYPVVNPGLSILVSAACVLLFDPVAIVSASFWLTFMAVMFIFLVLQGRLGSLVLTRSWIRVQLALFVGLMPLSLWYFGKVAMLGMLSNLVAVPLVGWAVVPLAFIFAVLGCLGDMTGVLASGVFWLLSGLIEGLFSGLALIQSLDAALLFSKPSIMAVLMALLGALLLCLPWAVPSKWAALLMFIPLLGSGISKTPIDRLQVLTSDPLLVVINHHTELVVIGSRYQSVGRIESQFRRYLQQEGIKSALDEPLLSVYRQWISERYFMLKVALQSQGLFQRKAVSIESFSLCKAEPVQLNALSVLSLVSEGVDRCQLLLSGSWGRYLLVGPGDVAEQLAFLDGHREVLTSKEVNGLLIGGNFLLSGALLNVIDPDKVIVRGNDVLDDVSLARIRARDIELVLQ